MFAIASSGDRSGGAIVDVATARTVLEFRDGIPRCCRSLGFLMRVCFEVTGVTAGTESGVRAESPRDYFIVAGMTAKAGDAAIVSTVAWTGMRVAHRCPGAGGMTAITGA